MPKSRLEFWEPKLEANKDRDIRNLGRLRKEGWRVLTIWECQLNEPERLQAKIRRFLDEKR
jgi:DNA mismatch endonuclease (patch repair protein)